MSAAPPVAKSPEERALGRKDKTWPDEYKDIGDKLNEAMDAGWKVVGVHIRTGYKDCADPATGEMRRIEEAA